MAGTIPAALDGLCVLVALATEADGDTASAIPGDATDPVALVADIAEDTSAAG